MWQPVLFPGAQIRQATSQALKNICEDSTKLVKTIPFSKHRTQAASCPDTAASARRRGDALLYAPDDARPHARIDRVVDRHNTDKNKDKPSADHANKTEYKDSAKKTDSKDHAKKVPMERESMEKISKKDNVSNDNDRNKLTNNSMKQKSEEKRDYSSKPVKKEMDKKAPSPKAKNADDSRTVKAERGSAKKRSRSSDKRSEAGKYNILR